MHNRYEEQHRYDDIIHLPHHVSAVHPPMSLEDRASQFSPFAALSGYHKAIEEAGRFTDQKRELDDHAKSLLDEQLRRIHEIMDSGSHCQVSASCFLPDSPGSRPTTVSPSAWPEPSGGTYEEISGAVKKIDFQRRRLVMEDGTVLAFDHIVDIQYHVAEL